MCEQGGKGVAEHTRGWHEECAFLSSEASRWHRKQLGWGGGAVPRAGLAQREV